MVIKRLYNAFIFESNMGRISPGYLWERTKLSGLVGPISIFGSGPPSASIVGPFPISTAGSEREYWSTIASPRILECRIIETEKPSCGDSQATHFNFDIMVL